MLQRMPQTNSKPLIVFLFSAMALGIMLIAVCISFQIIPRWYGLIAGIILMIAAIPMHILARKRPGFYLLSFLLNSVGNGLSVSACYSANHFMPDPFEMTLMAIPAFTLALLTYLMLEKFPSHKKLILTTAVISGAILATAFIVMWLKTGSAVYSFGLFPTLLTLCYLGVFGITVNHDRPVLKDVSYGGFGAFVIITIVVLIIISDGDFLDGIVPDFGGDGVKKQHVNDDELRKAINSK